MAVTSFSAQDRGVIGKEQGRRVGGTTHDLSLPPSKRALCFQEVRCVLEQLGWAEATDPVLASTEPPSWNQNIIKGLFVSMTLTLRGQEGDTPLENQTKNKHHPKKYGKKGSQVEDAVLLTVE